MTKKTWEFKIYRTQEEFYAGCPIKIESYFNRKADCIYECKYFVKKCDMTQPIITIQDSNREVIEMYNAFNQYGNIVFKKR